MLRLSRFTSTTRRPPSAAVARARLGLALGNDRAAARPPAEAQALRQPHQNELLARLLHEAPLPEGEHR